MLYYKRIDTEGKTTTVESYNHDKLVADAILIDKAEYDAFIASLPIPVVIVPRDYGKEIDDVKKRLSALEAK